MNQIDLQYPIGRYSPPASTGPVERSLWINEIEVLPSQLRSVVADLDDEQLATTYRPGGWTVRQVVHHLPDSHINSYTRFRLALTESNPVIKPYDEAAWADLADAKNGPIEQSLTLLDCLHSRWVVLLRSMDDAQFARTFRHPEAGERTLSWNLGLYAWHGQHHVAQIAGLRKRHGW